jgi:murein DD-endopeptidase MepM/ murein hydrolase activator NlpD
MYVTPRRNRFGSHAMAALGSSDIPTLAPEPGRAQPPIYPLIQGDHGGYLEARNSPADGSCGVGNYPCRHPGLDVFGMAGTVVVAPENGIVVAAADGSSSPFGGYGPWVIVMQGEGGKFHLLGHLEPGNAGMAPLGAQFRAGDPVGTTSGANHTHWEVRDTLIPDYQHGQTGFDIITDPVIWLTTQIVGGPLGAVLVVGSAAVLMYMLYRRRRRAQRGG